eukprot:GFKZ01015870.1.p1 GENE.GFKZ01015870.1~~GFKZ01015870.1.p1  ORF type:complete len:967 (-),score=186.65 GFKZ01015870.1:926-3826(-)
MSFFRSESPKAPLEDLLTRWECSLQGARSPSSPSGPPSFDAFLSDEDILRECRSDNPRLVKYICHPTTLSNLVRQAFQVPAELSSSGPHQSPRPSSHQQPSLEDPESFDADQTRERQLNFAYVASELLSTDNKVIADAILNSPDVSLVMFSAIELPDQGSLDTVVALHFSKVIVSLLEIRNAAVIQAMSARGDTLINGLLRHINSAPIADLIVRLLDGPEVEQKPGSQPLKRPPYEALELLSSADILGGLAECFVKASNDMLEMEVLGEGALDNGRAGDSEYDAQLRRLREETMANVTSTLLGLNARVLHLPSLGCAIPPRLCPYKMPVVISRLLDAGLYATCNGKIDANMADHAQRESATNEERVEAFCLRSNSALLHSLGLAADLMTANCNVVRYEEVTAAGGSTGPNPQGPGRNTSGSRHGAGRPVYAGKGIAPSLNAEVGKESATAEEKEEASSTPTRKASPEDLKMLSEYAKKKAGDTIVETREIEAELAIRFPRLSEMFGNKDEIDAGGVRLRPLGSLRLKLAEFFVACMKKASQETVEHIIDLGVPKKLLELFSKYQWSSMLHGVVTKSIVSALDGEEVGRPARSAWFDAGLIPWLIDSWQRNSVEEDDGPVRTRAGYMGHLIRIGTALKAYIEESQINPKADMPVSSQLQAFEVFAEKTLAPAHSREATPLCGEEVAGGGTGAAEEEEATDVLDMGSISFVENLTQAPNTALLQFYNPPKPGADADIEEEEEIKTVEVDDLGHFGADDDDVQEVKPLPDHDIPANLRDQLSKKEDAHAVKQVAEESIVDEPVPKQPYHTVGTESVSPGEDVKGPPHPSSNANEVVMDEFKGVIDNVDSSSEDEGSYIAFVDDKKDEEILKASSGMGRLSLSENDSAAGLDGIVTEIEEPGPLTPSGEMLQSLAANITSITDDNGNSSDDEYEEWEDPAAVLDTSESAHSDQAAKDSPEKSESRTTPVG